MLNNKPVARYANAGVGTRNASKNFNVQCELFKAPPLDLGGVEIPPGTVQSKLRKLKEKIKIHYKSNDDILSSMAKDHQPPESSCYNTRPLFEEISVQVGESLLADES